MYNSLIKTKCGLCFSDYSKLLFKTKLDISEDLTVLFNARRKRTINHFSIVKCLNCGLVRSLEVLPMKFVEKLYKKAVSYSTESYYAADSYYRLFEKHLSLSKNNRFLEIGCSNGSFLKKLYENGYCNLVGVEPSEISFNNIPSELRSLIFNDCFSLNLFGKKSFDAIFHFHLIDHLHEPLIFLKDCYCALQNNGHMFLVCHNVKAFSVFLLGRFSPIYDSSHIHLFDKNTLSKMLCKAGFKVLKIGSFCNKYSLSYWIKSLVFVNEILDFLPGWLLDLPITLPAGNMFAIAKK